MISNDLQANILSDIRAGTCPSRDANNITYIEYGLHDLPSIEQLFQKSLVDHVIIYTPDEALLKKIRNFKNDKIVASSDPKDFFGLQPHMVRIDAHIDGKQSDGEAVILGSMKKMLLDNRPFLFIRNDNPISSDPILHILAEYGYNTVFIVDSIPETQTISKVWVVGIPHNIPIDPNILSDKVPHPLKFLEEAAIKSGGVTLQ